MKYVRSTVVAMVLLVGVGIAYAASTPQPISGSVKDAKGSPAPSITLKLYQVVDPGIGQVGGESGRGGKRSTDFGPDVIQMGKGGTLKATIQSDKDGKYAFAPQAPGQYRILAGSNPRTTGMANVYVTVNEGQPATADIQLEVRK